MEDGYTTKRGIKQLDQNFKKIGLSNIDIFINNNLVKNTNKLGDVYSPVKEIKSKNLSYMNDRGEGRISLGVRSLDAITKTFKGITSGSLTLFDQIIFNNPYDFKKYDQTQSRAIIVDNLGLSPFIQTAMVISPKIVEQFYEMADRIFLDMKNLTFTYDKYISEVLTRSKLIVAASMNYQDII